MTPSQQELQMLIGDLKSETQTLNSLLDAQTGRIQTIKDRIDLQLRKIYNENND